MRTVFQLPARITSCAEAPRAVSSLASPTRSAGSTVTVPFSQRTDGARDVALDEAHVGRLAVGVGLAAADGDEQAVVAPRVGHVPPFGKGEALLNRRYLTFPDLKTLAARPRALDAFWVEGGDGDRDGDRPDLRQQLLRQVAEALGEPLVIRID